MAEQEFRFEGRAAQSQKQVQSQKMSQSQILSLNLLSLGTSELRDAIYDAAEKNPALVIAEDDFENGIELSKKKKFSENTRYGSVTQEGQKASDIFAEALENTANERITLKENLEQQFLMMPHSPPAEKLGLKLIHNLDGHGFHILSPYSLLDKNSAEETPELLLKCLNEIQNLDPVGTCCTNVEESLLIQAKAKKSVPQAALFILDGHFSFLSPPVIQKIQKKIEEFNEKQRSLSFGVDKNNAFKEVKFSDEEIEDAVAFIKTLDPYPARNFDSGQIQFVVPDVSVEKDEFTGNFKIRFAADSIPSLEISENFKEESKKRTRITKSTEESEKKRLDHRFVMESVRSANRFIDSVEFRKTTILKTVAEIVKSQGEFFKNGPGFLVPLRQKDVAENLKVHETTISRTVNGKYLQCQWGIFELSYFFTNRIGKVSGKENAQKSFKEQPSPVENPEIHSGVEKSFSDTNKNIEFSKESVKFTIRKILSDHKNDKKPLSDQKITDILAEQGIKIARRTVAKYRTELNIDSSYLR